MTKKRLKTRPKKKTTEEIEIPHPLTPSTIPKKAEELSFDEVYALVGKLDDSKDEIKIQIAPKEETKS